MSENGWRLHYQLGRRDKPRAKDFLTRAEAEAAKAEMRMAGPDVVFTITPILTGARVRNLSPGAKRRLGVRNKDQSRLLAFALIVLLPGVAEDGVAADGRAVKDLRSR